jgi:RNase P/RNase MRP subunit POP5
MVRFKNRYLLVEIMWEKSGGKSGKVPQTSRDEFSNAVKESVRLNFGDFGIGSIYSAFQGSSPKDT